MKKFLLSFLSLALLGVGCSSLGGQQVVQGQWTLAFDLPDGWVMVQPYQPADTPINVGGDINALDSEVVLQSTQQHILTGNVSIDEDREVLFGDYLTTDDAWTKISVLKLDNRRLIPSESEDLGNGFFKETVCEEGEDCTVYNTSRFVYYYHTDAAKYKFTVQQANADLQDAVDVIMTAQVVEEVLE